MTASLLPYEAQVMFPVQMPRDILLRIRKPGHVSSEEARRIVEDVRRRLIWGAARQYLEDREVSFVRKMVARLIEWLARWL